MNSNKPRQEATIPIGGLDTSTPDELAPNGTCATLHNLRYVDNAWHGVGPLTPLAEIPFGSTTEGSTTTTYFVKILYKHLASPDNKYIAFIKKKVTTEQGGGGTTRMELVGYAEVDITAERANPDGTMTTIADTVAMAQKAVLLDGLDANTDYTFTHFGKVLIAQGGGKLMYFIYNILRAKYQLFTLPEQAHIDNIQIDRSNTINPFNDDVELFADGSSCPCWHIMGKNSLTIMRPPNIAGGKYWWGEIAYLLVYKTEDGTLLCPSALQILCSEKNSSEDEYRMILSQDDLNDYISCVKTNTTTEGFNIASSRLRSFLPKLTISIPEIKSDIITKVAIYSTRINPIFDYEKITTRIDSFTRINNRPQPQSLSQYYANNHLPEQPLYLVDEIEIANISNNTWEVELGYDKLKDLTSKIDVYEPLNVHQIDAKAIYEYNNRLHLGDITSKFYSPTTNLAGVSTGGLAPSDTIQEYVSIDKAYGVYSSNNVVSEMDETIEEKTTTILQFNNPLITYPDYRAESILILGTLLNNRRYHRITLTPATANNIAYYIAPPTGLGKYSDTIIADVTTVGTLTGSRPIGNNTMYEPNRLQVSKAGNCFALPFDTSYNIGNEDTHILALGTTAEMLADSRFGDTPLYVFTNEGVWAAIQGQGEVLYSNWAFINPDRIINGSTAVANGLLFYITARGIHAISGRQAKLISTPIDDEGGQSPDFSSAEMWVQHLNNELVIYRGHNADDFVYNIDNGYWSTRTNCGRKIAQKQTVKETLWIDANYPTTGGSTQYIRIYDCEHEKNETVKASVTTRPIKLQRGAIARIENIITRLSGVARITIEIKGSNNLVDWATLRNVTFSPAERSVTIRHLPASAVYHVITLSADITLRKSITLFDITFYTKYLHKMR